MELRLNTLPPSLHITKENATQILSEDISLRKSSLLKETLEKTYTYKGEKIVQVRYKKTVIVGQTNIYRRSTELYAFLENGSRLMTPIDIRHKDYFSDEISTYKYHLFEQVIRDMYKKADKVDRLTGNKQTTQIFKSILSEASIAAAISEIDWTVDTSQLVQAINTVAQDPNNTISPFLLAAVPDWKTADSIKLGLPSAFVPQIKDWLLLFFNPNNFNKIYPQIINDHAE